MATLVFFASIALTMLLSAATHSEAAPQLTDSDATQALENTLNADVISLKLGPLSVLKPMMASEARMETGSITPAQHQFYQALETAGVISIKGDPAFQNQKSGKEFNWGTYGQQLTGVQDKIIVAATTDGERLAKTSERPQREGWLTFKPAVVRIEQLIKNEPYPSGLDDYRVLMARYSAQWIPELKRAHELLGTPVSDQRKIRVLLKFDPFKSIWNVVAADDANQDSEFTTNNVARVLSGH